VIENVKSDLDSVLDPILNKQTFRSAGVLSIKLGDGIIEYNKDFRLFLTSKMSNPHFSPETSTKITIVNFTITQEGLEDQLLELCISKEEPEDQELRSKLIIQGYENQ
jgi:dynein heavy chain